MHCVSCMLKADGGGSVIYGPFLYITEPLPLLFYLQSLVLVM